MTPIEKLRIVLFHIGAFCIVAGTTVFFGWAMFCLVPRMFQEMPAVAIAFATLFSGFFFIVASLIGRRDE